MSVGPTDEDTLCFNFRGLRIVVAAEAEGAPSTSATPKLQLRDQGTQTDSGPLVSELALAPVRAPAPDWTRLAQVFSASELNECELGDFASFAREIRSAGELGASGRIARAARAGWHARQVLSEDSPIAFVSASPPCTGRDGRRWIRAGFGSRNRGQRRDTEATCRCNLRVLLADIGWEALI